jgi:hypothetical protein
MVVGIVAMAFAAIAPCEAGWTYLGSSVSGGLPDSDWNQDRGSNHWWYWEYNVTNGDRGGNYYGSWAKANFDSESQAYVYSWSWEATSVSTSPDSDHPQPCIFGTSAYLNMYPQDASAARVDFKVDASGYVEVEGRVVDSNIAPTDTLYCSSSSWAKAEGYQEGWGYASGSVSQNGTGSTNRNVGGDGIATQQTSPTPIHNAGYYHAKLNFKVYVDDDDYEYIYLEAPAWLGIWLQSYASIDSSLGYAGSSWGKSEVDFGGESSADVTLP